MNPSRMARSCGVQRDEHPRVRGGLHPSREDRRVRGVRGDGHDDPGGSNLHGEASRVCPPVGRGQGRLSSSHLERRDYARRR